MIRNVLASAVAVIAVFALSDAAQVAAMDNQQEHLRITEAVDEHNMVTLGGNTRPEANARNDRGPVPDDLSLSHLLLLLKRSPQQESDLEEFINQLQNKTSPNYHHWLTAVQYGEQYGVAQQDIAAVTAWLESYGFVINVVYPSAMVIDFSGTAGQVREAFRTEIHTLEAAGEQHISNMSNPQIPAALAPVVEGIVSLNDFKPHPMYKLKTQPAYTVSSSEHLIVPADLATIYNLNPLFSIGISGQNQTVVVVEDTDVYNNGADWTTFRDTLGLAAFTGGSLTQSHPGNCMDPGVNSDEGEATLDAEYASAAAPSAAIVIASCSSTTTFGALLAILNLINTSGMPPAVMSMSYGECEAENGATQNAAYSSSFQQAASEGVSVFVSSGDEGAASCDADATQATHGIGTSGFATTPYNVAVGGTDFGDTYAGTTANFWNSTNAANYGSATSYIPEIPWNDSCASTLIAGFEGYSATYGTSGFCNSMTATTDNAFLSTAAGSGGPSGCATGSPSVSGVVSGTCAGWGKPAWQSGLFGNPSDGARDIPDVSLFAANGVWGHYYIFCWSDPKYSSQGAATCSGAPSNWSGAGGTSFSSPIMAGIQALVNQVQGRQGNPNPIYYEIAKSEYGPSGNSACDSNNLPLSGRGMITACVFYDVTQGDIDVNCGLLVVHHVGTAYNCYLDGATNGVLSSSNSAYQPAFGAAPGWDFATGIGSVNAYNLVFNTNW
jgi:subtilase family serine protease